jgi:hypothetical protein
MRAAIDLTTDAVPARVFERGEMHGHVGVLADVQDHEILKLAQRGKEFAHKEAALLAGEALASAHVLARNPD